MNRRGRINGTAEATLADQVGQSAEMMDWRVGDEDCVDVFDVALQAQEVSDRRLVIETAVEKKLKVVNLRKKTS